jgi:hypothetical protein
MSDGSSRLTFMRSTHLGFFIAAGLLAISSTARAQDALPPPAANAGATTGAPGAESGAPSGPAQVEALPPPQAGGPSGAEAAAAASGSMAAAPAAKGPSPSDWQFSWHGYFRAPLRIGVGHRNACPPGTLPSDTANQVPSNTQGASYNGPYCAAPGQSHTTFHNPYIPDDQYLSWTFDRQWEQAWAEIFLSFGNDKVVGTVGIQGYDFTDVGMLGNQPSPAQFGIGQGWLTITPDLPVDGLRMNWKVGAFWEKFGMAGKYDGGHYDTYMFGRTHQIGEALALQYDVGDFTLKASHGFGAHLEMTPAGIPISGNQNSLNYYNSGAANAYPPGASPGFTLLDHVHAGVSYKKWLDINAHYMLAWSQDDREQATLQTGTSTGSVIQSGQGDGSLAVYGVEARLLGGVFGEFYAGYSHIAAKNVTQVGPAIEVLHSSGGGGHNGANGIYENFFNGVGNGTGKIDSLQFAYDFSFGYLWRKLAHPNSAFWGDGLDVKLSLFLLYSSVTGTDPTSFNLFNGQATAGTQKLKYGADLVANLLPWFGVGVRGDYIQPDSHDVHQSFGVLSPKLIFRTKFITHEEIGVQYSHYWNGSDVLAQQWLSVVGNKNIASAAVSNNAALGSPKNYAGAPYPTDEHVFGIKASMWW